MPLRGQGANEMTTKNQALENLGYNKFQLLDEGINAQDTNEILAENQIYKCEVCKSWEVAETTGGNNEATLCEDCFHNSDHAWAKEARSIYGVEKPVKKKIIDDSWDDAESEEEFMINEDMRSNLNDPKWIKIFG